jgi:hypothetical protein
MEECITLLLVVALLDLGVNTQIHVPIEGGVVMADRYPLGGGKEVCEVAGRSWDGIDRHRIMCILRHVILGHMVDVVVELFL